MKIFKIIYYFFKCFGDIKDKTKEIIANRMLHDNMISKIDTSILTYESRLTFKQKKEIFDNGEKIIPDQIAHLLFSNKMKDIKNEYS